MCSVSQKPRLWVPAGCSHAHDFLQDPRNTRDDGGEEGHLLPPHVSSISLVFCTWLVRQVVWQKRTTVPDWDGYLVSCGAERPRWALSLLFLWSFSACCLLRVCSLMFGRSQKRDARPGSQEESGRPRRQHYVLKCDCY